MTHLPLPRSAFSVGVISFLAALAGCSRSELEAPNAGTTGGGGPIGDITGKVLTTYVTAQGDASVPRDLSAATVSAIYKIDDSWTLTLGVGKADGTFVISGVPEVPYMLLAGHGQYFTRAREITLDYLESGREDRAFATKKTEISAEMDGLAPWDPDDSIEWYSGEVNGFAPDVYAEAPNSGATALTGQKFSWVESALPDAGKGDKVYVTQLSRHAGADGTPYSTIHRAALLDDVTVVDGAVTPVTGTFGAAMIHQSVAVDFRASELLTAAAAINPGAKPAPGTFFQVAAQPEVAIHGLTGFAAPLVKLAGVVKTGKDLNLGTVTFDDPFPASWGAYGVASLEMGVDYPVPGSKQILTQTSLFLMSADLATLGAGPFRPVLTPVLDPRVNGESAFDALTGITTSPVLSWSPPALGAPTMYIVVIYDVEDADGAKAFFFHGGFFSSETTVPLQPGALAEGKPVLFAISALMDPAADPSHPMGRSVNQALVTTLSNLLIP